MSVYAEAMAEAVTKLVLRLAPDLHTELVEWAREEERSLNGQIVYLLRRALREWRKPA